MQVQAKFIITRKETTRQWMGQDRPQTEVVAVFGQPVYGGGGPDDVNKQWWEATPSGQLQLGCVNKAAADALVIGEEYLVTFTHAPRAPKVEG